MRISVIIPYTKGDSERQYGLLEMMECIKKQTYRDFEVIFCEVTRDGTSIYMPAAVDQKLLLKHDGLFNKCWAVNCAVRKAKNDFLLILDADTIFKEDYFQKIVDFYKEFKNPFFVAYESVHFRTGRDEPTKRSLKSTYIRAAAHAWCCTKEFFWKIGGMNEKYEGYGAEDQDFWERAKHVDGVVMNMEYDIEHAYHNWHPRDSNFPLNPKRVPLLYETKRDPGAEIEKLKAIAEHLGGDKPYV